MARLARVVIPGLPHHVTRRGNRRETVFFDDDDYRACLGLPEHGGAQGAQRGLGLAPDAQPCAFAGHVHLTVVPSHEDGLRAGIANAHRRYAARINAKNK